ncbi:MAG: cbb3-type cytochrome c oxidase subunit I [Rhodothermales bacterium]
MIKELFTNDYGPDGFRTCSVTGMRIDRTAENFVKIFGLTAVVALVMGGISAILVVLTRWEVVGLLPPDAFYNWLSVHAWNLLIFWMVFMEVAILYVGGPMVLGRKLPAPKLAMVGYVLMLVSAIGINWSIMTTSAPDQAPLLTSYAPLPSSEWFYLSAIVFILGTVIAALPFFAAIWQEKIEHPNRSLPLVAFGAFITAIIAVEALLGGLITYIPTYMWRIGLIEHIDAAWYRQMYWIIGHGSQQINLAAMVTVWYFLTHVVGGAEVVSEKVSRSAFILYLFFINMGAAHHLMADPALAASWKVWNTSYAAYGAVLASMIHAFAIPAGLEAGRRKRGAGKSLFGWLWSAPWGNPVFSAVIFSIILFGFMGGITGVLMGQMQLNLAWHNTWATVGHFHATVVLGTTMTFMGLVFFVIQTMFKKELIMAPLARIQPWFYSGFMALATLMMMYLGILYGIPRRHASVMDIPGTDFNFGAAEPLFVIFGIAALLAIVGGILFAGISVGSLLFGKKLEPSSVFRPAASWTGDGSAVHLQSMRGTFTFTLIFLAVFVIAYILNWYLLSRLWEIG